jgi:hypothetical protein
MANDLTPAQARRRALTQSAGQGLGISQPRHIQRMNGRFTLIEDTGEAIQLPGFDQEIGPFVDVIVIDANPAKSKVYYPPNTYDPNRPAPPHCYSDNGVGPSVNSLHPQAPTCARCPQSKIGSAISPFSGDQIAACRDRKKLAVLVSGQPGGAWLFDVPAASLRKWRDYIEWLVRQKHPDGTRMCDVTDMITRVYYAAGKPNILEFRSAGFTTPQISAYIDKVLETDDTTAMVGASDKAMPQEVFEQHQLAASTGDTPPAPAKAVQAPMPVQAPKFALVPPSGPGVQAPFVLTQASPDTAKKAAAPPANEPKRKYSGKKKAGQSDNMDVPDFLKSAPTPAFGMSEGASPDAGMAQAVADAFNIPTDNDDDA